MPALPPSPPSTLLPSPPSSPQVNKAGGTTDSFSERIICDYTTPVCETPFHS